jgi:hypothetical protein
MSSFFQANWRLQQRAAPAAPAQPPLGLPAQTLWLTPVSIAM